MTATVRDTEESSRFLGDVERFLKLLWRPGEIREVRIIGPKGPRAAGWFDDPDQVAPALAGWDGKAHGFVTMNPVAPGTFPVTNSLGSASTTTADVHIECRAWFLLDVDPIRASNTSSTEGEREGAREVLEHVVAFLKGQGWPDPIVSMSGNGYYANYRVELPNDQESREAAHRNLKFLAEQFDTEAAHVDTTVYNAARIQGVVGMVKVKGEASSTRPHRRSHLVSVPEALVTLSAERFFGLVPREAQPRLVAGDGEKHEPEQRGQRPWSVRARLDGAGVEYREQRPDAAGITWYHLRRCPFHADGKDFECGVGQMLPGGRGAGKCFHPEGEGMGWEEFREALGLAPMGRRPGEIIVSGRQLPEVVADAWQALDAANEPRWLFNRGGSIVKADPDRSNLTTCNLPMVKGTLARAANWLKVERNGELSAARPPKDVIEDMLAFPESLPTLRALVTVPVLTAAGELWQDPGYQPVTQLYYVLAGQPIPAVPARPSAEDVERALALIVNEWLGDFPFDSDASRANAIASVVGHFTFEMHRQGSPLFAIDAPTPGTGKGFLATTIGVVIEGRAPSLTVYSRDSEEMRKRLTAQARAGTQVILFDNLKSQFDSDIVAAGLTAPTWSDRILGSSEMVSVENRFSWFVTGNNVEMDQDIARRTVWVRLDAKVSQPWLRTGFRHEDIVAWVTAHRHELVWAVLVLCRHWNAGGKTPWSGNPIGSYGPWCRVVGGILEAAGVGGFLMNRDELYRKADPETAALESFFSQWWDLLGPSPVGVAELFPLVRDRELLPHLFGHLRMDLNERSARTKLGTALRKLVGRRFGRMTLREAGQDGKSKALLYRLEVAEPDAESPRGSREVPVVMALLPDSRSEPPEPSEPLSPPRARADHRTVQLHAQGDGVADQVPEVPEVPWLGSDEACSEAEPDRDLPRGDQKVPPRPRRCAGCAAAHSCGGCAVVESFCGCESPSYERDATGLWCAGCYARQPAGAATEARAVSAHGATE